MNSIKIVLKNISGVVLLLGMEPYCFTVNPKHQIKTEVDMVECWWSQNATGLLVHYIVVHGWERGRERLARTPGGFMIAHCIEISYMKGRKKNVKIDLHTFQLVCNKLNFHFHFSMKLSFSSCWFIFLRYVFNLYENGRWIFDRIITYTAMNYKTISSNFSNLLSRYISKIQPSFLLLQTTKSNPTLSPPPFPSFPWFFYWN